MLLWLWVAVRATTVVFHIGRRTKDELATLIGDAFLGWLVSGGYGAYRDHPRRQRCLAHLIRKAVALAEGYYRPGSGFGREIARDLRGLIEKLAAGGSDASIKRLLTRLKWNCQANQYAVEDKVRALAREILNDWDAVIAFVHDPSLPPTNNDAERALRHAVIARRIGYGTRTDEGSRCLVCICGCIFLLPDTHRRPGGPNVVAIRVKAIGMDTEAAIGQRIDQWPMRGLGRHADLLGSGSGAAVACVAALDQPADMVEQGDAVLVAAPVEPDKPGDLFIRHRGLFCRHWPTSCPVGVSPGVWLTLGASPGGLRCTGCHRASPGPLATDA